MSHDQTAGPAGDFDPSGTPPHQDPAGEAEHEEKVRRANDLFRRLPGQIKEAPEAAFEPATLELLAFARRHLPGAWVAFKQACRRLGVIRDLERAIADLERESRPRNAGDYARDGSGICHLSFDPRGYAVRVRLTNFDAEIVAVTVADDGVERRRHLSVDCVFEGAPTSVMVPAADFNGMGWVGAELPAGAYVLPSQERRAAVAIRELSRDVVERVQYQHTGWRNIDGQDVFLHGGGAVGPVGPVGPVESVEVELGENRRLRLVDPGDDLPTALSASLAVFDVAPLRVTVPLMAAVARSALTASDFTFYLHGRTGTFKSELAALAQQHFGPELSARNLVSFESTANSLEERAFVAKDVALVIDDYVTNGSTREVADMRAKAGRLVRAQGNQAGRGRLNRDSQARPVRPPRGTLIMTGEDLPVGHSILARLVAVEVQEGDVDEARLTIAQEQAADGLFAQAMFGYVRHLANDLAGHRKQHKRRVRELLPRFRGAHARTPVTFAELSASLESYLEFAGAADRLPSYLDVLAEVAAEQGESQRDEAATTRFLNHLGAAIRAGAAHLANADDAKQPPADALQWGWRFREQVEGMDPEVRLPLEPRGDRVGWIWGEDAYLDADNAFAAAQAHARKSGAGDLGVKASTLWKRLKQAGLLASVDHPQTTRARATIWGRRVKTIIHLRSSLLETGPDGPTGPNPGGARVSGEAELGPGDEELGQTGPAEEKTSDQKRARPRHDRAGGEEPGQGADPGNTSGPQVSGRPGPVGPVRDGGERPRENYANAKAAMRLEDLGAAFQRQLAGNPEFWSDCAACGERFLPAAIQVVGGRSLCPRCATAARAKAGPAAEPPSSTCSMEGCGSPYWGTVFGATRTCRRCNGRLRRAVRKLQGGGGEPTPELLRAAVEQVELDILLS